MPGKRSAVIAPGQKSAMANSIESNPALMQEAIDRLESGALTEQWIADTYGKNPAEFEATLGDTLDDLARNNISWHATRCFRYEDEPLKVRDFDRIIQAHIDECKRDGKWAGILAPPESGKALSVDTEIPTPTGFRRIGDLKIGDSVYGRDGRPCSVTWTSPVQLNREVFNVLFDDGASVLADADHRWLAWTPDDRRTPRWPSTKHVTKDQLRVVTTRDMINTGLRRSDRWCWFIPTCAAVSGLETELPVHPYVLGAWLGDGNSAGPRITYHEDDSEVIERCVKIEGGVAGPPSRQGESNVFNRTVGGSRYKKRDPDRLKMRLRKLGVINNKHIPESYLLASEKQRRELLAGLLDTDGSVCNGPSGGSSRIELSFCREVLARGAVELIRSLGFKASIKASAAKIYGRTVGTRWRITFTAREPVFLLKRKLVKQKLDGDKRVTGHRSVRSITPVESVPVVCIKVDSPDHSYLATRSYVVTHNTSQVSLIRASWLVCKNPNIEIKIVSGADDTSVKRVKALGRLFMFDKSFKRVWGHVVQPSQARVRGADPYNDHKITVARTTQSPEPTVEAYGVLSTAAGSRCHVLIFDDAIDEKSALWSAAAKHHVNDAIQNTWLSRVRKGHRDSHVIWICTTWSGDDQSSIFMASAKWRFLVVAVSDDFTHLVCKYIEKGVEIGTKKCPLPEPWTAQLMKDTAESMTRAAWDRMYRQITTSEVDRVLVHAEDCFDPQADMRLVGKRAQDEGWTCYVGVDVSAKRRRGTAIVTVGIEPKTMARIPVDARLGAWASPDICEQLNDVFLRYNPKVVRVENNSVQELFLDFASHVAQGDPSKYPWARRLEPHLTTGRLKHDGEAGVAAMDIEFRNKGWVIPARHMLEHDYNAYEHYSRCGPCSLTRQLFDYPNHPTNDMIMALWIARNAADAYDPRQGEAIRKMIESIPEDHGLATSNDWL